MRVSISGSPVASSRSLFRSFTASVNSLWRLGSMPGGGARSRIGLEPLRNGTPWYVLGRNPELYNAAPPRGPRGPDCSTTNPGKLSDSLPRPYVAHAPMLGRPEC